MSDLHSWIDRQEEKTKEERSQGYFEIVEGKQTFQLLSHCAPYAQVYEGGKYRPAEEGDRNVSIRGVCWVLQDGVIKQAKLPYTLVKAIRGIQQDPEWEFSIPFLHNFNLEAIGAGTKEVKYTLTPSPKKIDLAPAILEELRKKPTPEEIVEKIKQGKSAPKSTEDTREAPTPVAYPEEEINPADIPF